MEGEDTNHVPELASWQALNLSVSPHAGAKLDPSFPRSDDKSAEENPLDRLNLQAPEGRAGAKLFKPDPNLAVTITHQLSDVNIVKSGDVCSINGMRFPVAELSEQNEALEKQHTTQKNSIEELNRRDVCFSSSSSMCNNLADDSELYKDLDDNLRISHRVAGKSFPDGVTSSSSIDEDELLGIYDGSNLQTSGDKLLNSDQTNWEQKHVISLTAEQGINKNIPEHIQGQTHDSSLRNALSSESDPVQTESEYGNGYGKIPILTDKFKYSNGKDVVQLASGDINSSNDPDIDNFILSGADAENLATSEVGDALVHPANINVKLDNNFQGCQNDSSSFSKCYHSQIIATCRSTCDSILKTASSSAVTIPDLAALSNKKVHPKKINLSDSDVIHPVDSSSLSKHLFETSSNDHKMHSEQIGTNSCSPASVSQFRNNEQNLEINTQDIISQATHSLITKTSASCTYTQNDKDIEGFYNKSINTPVTTANGDSLCQELLVCDIQLNLASDQKEARLAPVQKTNIENDAGSNKNNIESLVGDNFLNHDQITNTDASISNGETIGDNCGEGILGKLVEISQKCSENTFSKSSSEKSESATEHHPMAAMHLNKKAVEFNVMVSDNALIDSRTVSAAPQSSSSISCIGTIDLKCQAGNSCVNSSETRNLLEEEEGISMDKLGATMLNYHSTKTLDRISQNTPCAETVKEVVENTVCMDSSFPSCGVALLGTQTSVSEISDSLTGGQTSTVLASSSPVTRFLIGPKSFKARNQLNCFSSKQENMVSSLLPLNSTDASLQNCTYLTAQGLSAGVHSVSKVKSALKDSASNADMTGEAQPDIPANFSDETDIMISDDGSSDSDLEPLQKVLKLALVLERCDVYDSDTPVYSGKTTTKPPKRRKISDTSSKTFKDCNASEKQSKCDDELHINSCSDANSSKIHSRKKISDDSSVAKSASQKIFDQINSSSLSGQIQEQKKSETTTKAKTKRFPVLHDLKTGNKNMDGSKIKTVKMRKVKVPSPENVPLKYLKKQFGIDKVMKTSVKSMAWKKKEAEKQKVDGGNSKVDSTVLKRKVGRPVKAVSPEKFSSQKSLPVSGKHQTSKILKKHNVNTVKKGDSNVQFNQQKRLINLRSLKGGHTLRSKAKSENKEVKEQPASKGNDLESKKKLTLIKGKQRPAPESPPLDPTIPTVEVDRDEVVDENTCLFEPIKATNEYATKYIKVRGKKRKRKYVLQQALSTVGMMKYRLGEEWKPKQITQLGCDPSHACCQKAVTSKSDIGTQWEDPTPWYAALEMTVKVARKKKKKKPHKSPASDLLLELERACRENQLPDSSELLQSLYNISKASHRSSVGIVQPEPPSAFQPFNTYQSQQIIQPELASPHQTYVSYSPNQNQPPNNQLNQNQLPVYQANQDQQFIYQTNQNQSSFYQPNQSQSSFYQPNQNQSSFYQPNQNQISVHQGHENQFQTSQVNQSQQLPVFSANQSQHHSYHSNQTQPLDVYPSSASYILKQEPKEPEVAAAPCQARHSKAYPIKSEVVQQEESYYVVQSNSVSEESLVKLEPWTESYNDKVVRPAVLTRVSSCTDRSSFLGSASSASETSLIPRQLEEQEEAEDDGFAPCIIDTQGSSEDPIFVFENEAYHSPVNHVSVDKNVSPKSASESVGKSTCDSTKSTTPVVSGWVSIVRNVEDSNSSATVSTNIDSFRESPTKFVDLTKSDNTSAGKKNDDSSNSPIVGVRKKNEATKSPRADVNKTKNNSTTSSSDIVTSNSSSSQTPIFNISPKTTSNSVQSSNVTKSRNVSKKSTGGKYIKKISNSQSTKVKPSIPKPIVNKKQKQSDGSSVNKNKKGAQTQKSDKMVVSNSKGVKGDKGIKVSDKDKVNDKDTSIIVIDDNDTESESSSSSSQSSEDESEEGASISDSESNGDDDDVVCID